MRWSVCDEADVPNAVDGLLEGFAEIGLPYLEKYSDLATALAAISSDERSAWLHSPIDNERAKRAVGIAYLLHDKATVAKLIETKTKYLEQRNDFGLQSFRDFVGSLRE